MNMQPDAHAAENDRTLDPQQAAAMLHRTSRQAYRQLEPTPPLLLTCRGVLVLAALGAIWLSVRGQHPYKGPTATDAAILAAFVVGNFIATVAVREHALSGIRGRSRLNPAEITIAVLAWVSTAVLVIVLAAAHNSFGTYPTTVLIIPGLVWAGLMGARSNWRGCATGLAVAAVGVAGLFAGPAGSWAAAGVGLCAVLVSNAVCVSWRQHA